MWSSNFEGFWPLTRPKTVATARRPLKWALTCDDMRTVTDHLSAHLMRDIGLSHRCERGEEDTHD